jgi:hypothetical protein
MVRTVREREREREREGERERERERDETYLSGLQFLFASVGAYPMLPSVTKMCSLHIPQVLSADNEGYRRG